MKQMKSLTVLLLLFVSAVVYAGDGGKKMLWYKQPAQKWDAEGLPIGNGRMGAMMMEV